MFGYSHSALHSIKTAGLMFVVVFAIFYISRDLRINNSQAIVPDSDVVLYLEERINLDEFILQLADLNVHFDETELRWVASMLGWRNFNPGRYKLSEASSYQDLLSRVAMGIQDHATIVIHPGTTKERLITHLASRLRADALQFETVFSDSSSLLQELGKNPQALFSRMLPDTYNVYWTSSPESVVRRIYREFQNRVENQYADEIADHSFDLEELITLASIVEWEANFSSEKPKISGLYQNRLNRNMRLQADPTVIYAIGEHRRLLFDDYNVDHPYNTYQISGLPPGPITNPDITSIRAAMNPEEHDYLYMVANPEGGHVFNETFEQHRVASSEWRRWIREQVRIREERDRMQDIGDQQTH